MVIPIDEMPLYQCHKRVRALQIREIDFFDEADQVVEIPEISDSAVSGVAYAMIQPEEKGIEAFRVEKGYIRKHLPRPGGFFVVYEDGYASWSPGDVFEDGYSLCV